jgi:hypothetical protein
MEIITVAIVVLIVIIFSINIEVRRKERLMKYWSRPCMGKQWKKRFPHVAKAEIRSYLEAFVESFAFKRDKKLKFEPNDKIIDIYQTLYPENERHLGDGLELESFAVDLEKNYGVDLVAIWNDELTLGQLFELIRKGK